MKLTYPEWERYASDLKAHELRMQETEPQPENFDNRVTYLRAKSMWDTERAMTEPNKPGYYRANND